MKKPEDILFRHWKAWADATFADTFPRQDMEENGLVEMVVPAMEEWAEIFADATVRLMATRILFWDGKGKFQDASIQELAEIVRHAPRLLRSLHDIQNGPPLEKYREEWEDVMKEVGDFLNQHETE